MSKILYASACCGFVLFMASVSAAVVPGPYVTGAQLKLKYEAFVAGIPAGEAVMQLQRDPLDRTDVSAYQYRVAGTARSTGLWESFQQWRAEYSVDGTVTREVAEGNQERRAQTMVLPGHFFSLQTTPRKRREIHIEDGILKETKNHKIRDPRPSQTGYDLFSALFFLPPCHPEVRVHTGRDGYSLQRSSPGDAVDTQPSLNCRYRVRDDDGSEYKMKLTYAQRGGFVVPVEIVVQGPLNGRMRLVEPASRAANAQ